MSNVGVVRAMYDAFGKRDEAAFAATLHPDVEWLQAGGFPGGGHHRGRDAALNATIRKLNTMWDNFATTVDEYLDAGHAVIATGHYSGTHRETGKAMRAAFAHVYYLDGGLISRYVQYTDTHAIVRAMQP